MPRPEHRRPTRIDVARLQSWGWDYLAVVGWLLTMGVALGLPVTAGWVSLDVILDRAVATDLALMTVTVIPLFLYLVATEASASRATPGKRRVGLVVHVRSSTNRVGRVMVRNAAKVAPWQLGHMAAWRFATGEPSIMAIASLAASFVLLFAVAGPPLVRCRGLHDLISGSTVRPLDRISSAI